MKKQLLTSLAAVAFSVAAYSQTENVAGNRQLAPARDHSAARSQQVVTCGPDTIVYPYLKELVFAAPNDSFFIDAMVGNVRTASQAYHTTENVMIHGVQFWGAAYSTSTSPQTLQVEAYLYAVDAMNMPTAILDSATVTITEQYDFYEAYFTTPYSYGQNFAVAVHSVPSDTLAVVTNNAGNVWTPNYGESLGWRRFGSGTWNSALSFFGQDLEYMIFPIVSYNVTASFNMPNDTACMNQQQNFTNLSSDLFGNRFFNLLAFDEYWGFAAADSSFWWNYGDSPSVFNSYDGMHTYTTSGSYDVTLLGSMIGYYSTCMDTAVMSLEIMPDVIANFTYDNSAEPTIAFMDASTGGMSYWWDFGDTATSTSANPSHTYAGAGTYTVTLVTTGFCGMDTTTQVITIIGSGVAQQNAASTAWFSTGDQSLNINLQSTDAVISVYGMAGNLIYSENAGTDTSRRIDMSNAAAGVYFVQIQSGTEISTIQFAVVK